MVRFETASRDTQALNLSRNMNTFYGRQVGSRMNRQQSQNLLLKVDLPSTIRNNNKSKHQPREFLYRIYRRWLHKKQRYRFLFLVFSSPFKTQCKKFILFCQSWDSGFLVHVRWTACIQRKY